jgi:hypothetical protein
MDEAEFQRQKDDAYRALGRYIAEFSRLIYNMRDAIEQRLTRPEDPPLLLPLVFSGAPAAAIANTFFGMCKMLGDLDNDEAAIHKRLFEEVVFKVIPERNNLAHGDWWIGWTAANADEIDTPAYTRAIAREGEGMAWTHISVEKLDAQSDRLIELRNLVTEFGLICFGRHILQRTARAPNLRVRDLFVLTGPRATRRVERSAPRAQDSRFRTS